MRSQHHRPVSERQAEGARAGNTALRQREKAAHCWARAQNNLKNDQRGHPAGRVRVRDGRFRLGQVLAHQRDPLQIPGSKAQRRQEPAGRLQGHPRRGGAGQGDRDQSGADRTHAALEPGDVHRRVRPTSASSMPPRRTPSCAATGPGGSRSTCKRRPLRGLLRATASSRSRCISCRMCMCRATCARGGATTARRSRSNTRARAFTMCWR